MSYYPGPYFSCRSERSAEPWTWPYGRWPWAFILESIPPFRLFRVELPRERRIDTWVLNLKWGEMKKERPKQKHSTCLHEIVGSKRSVMIECTVLHMVTSPHGNRLCLVFSQQSRLRCIWASFVWIFADFCSLFCLSTCIQTCNSKYSSAFKVIATLDSKDQKNRIVLRCTACLFVFWCRLIKNVWCNNVYFPHSQ